MRGAEAETGSERWYKKASPMGTMMDDYRKVVQIDLNFNYAIYFVKCNIPSGLVLTVDHDDDNNNDNNGIWSNNNNNHYYYEENNDQEDKTSGITR